MAECPSRSIATEWLDVLTTARRIPDRPSPVLPDGVDKVPHPEYAADWETAVNDSTLPVATRLALNSMDPCNVTLEPEYYADCDQERFQRVKPLLWLW